MTFNDILCYDQIVSFSEDDNHSLGAFATLKTLLYHR